MNWTWGWLPRNPPGHFGDNLVFDLIRLVVVLMACLAAFYCLRVIREQRRRAQRMPWGQAGRFIALALLDLYVCVTELAVFGTVATPRLFVGLTANVTAMYGIRSMRRKQLAQPVIR